MSTMLDDAAQRIADLSRRLRPSINRTATLAELDEIFRASRVPDPPPSGFHAGRLVTLAIWGPSDAAVNRLGDVWMPWLGKSFDAAASTGLNVLTATARAPMRLLWPSYVPLGQEGDRLDVFPFRTSVGPGAADPDVTVLNIDYDFEANPSFIIRRVLDQVVEVSDGLLLGKIFFRLGGARRPIGFFTLQRPPA